MKDEILSYITQADHVSFVELQQRFSQCFDGGSLALTLEEYNIVLWIGFTQEGCKAMSELLKDNLIHFKPCSTLIYMVDGRLLNFPIAKRERKYKKPCWLPVVMRPGIGSILN